MSIQSNVNQMISIASYLASQSPVAEERREEARVGKQSEALKEKWQRDLSMAQQEQKTEETVFGKPDPDKDAEAKLKLAKQAGEAYSQTGDPYFLDKFRKWTLFGDIAKDRAMKASEQAKGNLEVKQEEKRASRRNFIDYMKDEPTSLGNFGTLNPKLQKAIAATYSKQERKKYMDEKDAMNE